MWRRHCCSMGYNDVAMNLIEEKFDDITCSMPNKSYFRKKESSSRVRKNAVDMDFCKEKIIAEIQQNQGELED